MSGQGCDFKKLIILSTPPLKKRKVLLVAPIFGSGIDFSVFDPKLWGFGAIVLALRS